MSFAVWAEVTHIRVILYAFSCACMANCKVKWSNRYTMLEEWQYTKLKSAYFLIAVLHESAKTIQPLLWCGLWKLTAHEICNTFKKLQRWFLVSSNSFKSLNYICVPPRVRLVKTKRNIEAQSLLTNKHVSCQISFAITWARTPTPRCVCACTCTMHPIV